METLLVSNDLWEYVEPEDASTLTEAQKQQLKAHKRNDARALSMVQQRSCRYDLSKNYQ